MPLERCLALLCGHQGQDSHAEGAARTLEVVVVDNDSADGRLAEFKAAWPAVRFIANRSNLGFSSGCNLGAGKARGRLLLFMNPDVEASEADVWTLADEKEADPSIAVLTARQIDSRGRVRKAFDVFPSIATSFAWVRGLGRALSRIGLVAFDRFADPRAAYGGRVECEWVSGSLLMMAKEDFEAIGGFSEEFWMYCEDVDLCWRVCAAGMKVAYTPAVTFVHSHGGASRRDRRTTALTKAETVISKHVYISRHFSGLYALVFHLTIAFKNVIGLLPVVAVALSGVGLFSRLGVAPAVLGRLLVYYGGVLVGRGFVSPRAPTSTRRG